LAQRHEAAHRAFLGDEEGRVHRVVGVIHGDDQVPFFTGNPLVARAILMQHHADHRPPLPLAPVLAATLGAFHRARRL
jgi:hypothetical protein